MVTLEQSGAKTISIPEGLHQSFPMNSSGRLISGMYLTAADGPLRLLVWVVADQAKWGMMRTHCWRWRSSQPTSHLRRRGPKKTLHLPITLHWVTRRPLHRNGQPLTSWITRTRFAGRSPELNPDHWSPAAIQFDLKAPFSARPNADRR